MKPEVVQTQILAGVAVAYVIEWMKKTERFPWLSIHSTELTRVVSLAVALVMGIGVTITWGDHQVILGWPTSLDAAISEFKNAFTSWIVQEATYKGFIRKPAEPVFVSRLPRTDEPVRPAAASLLTKEPDA